MRGFEQGYKALKEKYNFNTYLRYLNDYLDCKAINFQFKNFMSVKTIKYDAVIGTSTGSGFDRNLSMLVTFEKMMEGAQLVINAFSIFSSEEEEAFLQLWQKQLRTIELIDFSKNTFIYHDLMVKYISYFELNIQQEYQTLKDTFLKDWKAYYEDFNDMQHVVDENPLLFNENKCSNGYDRTKNRQTYYDWKRVYAYSNAYLNGYLTYGDLFRLMYFYRGGKSTLKKIKKNNM